MRLEIDATVQYVLLRQHFRLSYRQTEVESPYNTYLHKGLPPGPIANPGRASIACPSSGSVEVELPTYGRRTPTPS